MNNINNDRTAYDRLVGFFTNDKQRPWYQRNATCLAEFIVFLLLWIVIWPKNGNVPTGTQKGIAVALIVVTLIWMFIILLDQLKPIWFQSLAALFFVAQIAFYIICFSGANFDNLAFIFANKKVMAGQWHYLFDGLKMTLILAALSIIFETIGGLALAILRFMKNKVISGIVIAYLTFFRVMPLLVIVYFIYFGLPSLNIYVDGFTCAVLTLSLSGAAFISEVFRAGIESVDRTQVEASRALGLTYFQSMRLVVLPQAIKVVVPAVVNQWVGTLKDTSVMSLVSITELLKAAKLVSTMKANPTPLICGALVYLVVLVPMTILVASLEKNSKKKKVIKDSEAAA